ncbi:hypothetical protein DTJ15_03645 [Parasaccharibacter sp. TMW 2.1891]|nr:hypothetical protein [Parasaccharibacter sp. TMW 2.1891]
MGRYNSAAVLIPQADNVSLLRRMTRPHQGIMIKLEQRNQQSHVMRTWLCRVYEKTGPIMCMEGSKNLLVLRPTL